MTHGAAAGRFPDRLWVGLHDSADVRRGSFATLVPRRVRPGRVACVALDGADPGDAIEFDVNAVIPGWGAHVVFVAVLRRRGDVDHAFFSRYWREDHARFGGLIAGARAYVQLHAVEGAAVDGVCLVPFDNVETLEAAFAAPVIRVEARADEARFIDHSRSYGMVCDLVPGGPAALPRA
jgi:hypothetical protein